MIDSCMSTEESEEVISRSAAFTDNTVRQAIIGLHTVLSRAKAALSDKNAYESTLLAPTLDKFGAYGLNGILLNEYVNWSLTLLRSRQHAPIAIQLITATMYTLSANLYAALRHYSRMRGKYLTLATNRERWLDLARAAPDIIPNFGHGNPFDRFVVPCVQMLCYMLVDVQMICEQLATPSCPTITTFNPLLNRCHWLLRFTRATCSHAFYSDNANVQMVNVLIDQHISDDDSEETVE